jgi:hypothetical protein
MSFHDETEVVRVRTWLNKLAGRAQDIAETVAETDFPAPSTIRSVYVGEADEETGSAVVEWITELDEVARRIVNKLKTVGIDDLPF